MDRVNSDRTTRTLVRRLIRTFVGRMCKSSRALVQSDRKIHQVIVNVCHMRTVEAQIILCSLAVRSGFSLSANLFSIFYSVQILSADNENHDQTMWLHRPICAWLDLWSETEILVSKSKYDDCLSSNDQFSSLLRQLFSMFTCVSMHAETEG